MTDDEFERRRSALIQTISDRMSELGVSRRQLSINIGRDASFLQDFLGPVRKKDSLGSEALAAIEIALNFQRGELSEIIQPNTGKILSLPVARKFPVINQTGLPAARKLPLYAMVNLRTGGVRMSKAAEFETPIGLESNEKTFVVIMPDATMRPAFDAGHKVVVQPDAPLSGAEFVFIERRGAETETEGFVRRLYGRDEAGLLVETLNPAGQTLVPHDDIVSIAPVVAILFR